jgi:pyrroline-5-carboxylate reductase
MTDTIGFIGAGNMAGAIIHGILKNKVAGPGRVAVYDVNPEKTAAFAKEGVLVQSSLSALAGCSTILFLAVKPQNYPEVLSALGQESGFGSGEKIVVSIAAGISTAYIKRFLGDGCKVVRAMPNTPLLLGEGATALCDVEPVTEEDFQTVRHIFEAGGIVEVLPEDKMNAVISVNGSSPAYVYLFSKAVQEGARSQGIDPETAKNLFAQTLIGSAKMLTDSGKTPDELITMVSSKGGTTIAALEALYEGGLVPMVEQAMERCTKRAEELGK